ncbi:MAG: YIP1 family protein [Blastocatellales bacterium]
MRTLDILFDPADLFKRLNDRPNWLTPFVIVTLLAALSTALLAPVIEQLAIKQMPEGVSADLQERMLSSILLSKYYGIAIVPVVVLLKWSILAFLLFGVAILVGADTSYRKALSVLGHASIITSLDTLANVVVIYLRGVETIQSPSDIQATVVSPAYLLSASAHPAFRVALENLNLFSLWYFALLWMGLYQTARLSKLQSAFVVGVLWILQTSFLVILTLIFSRISAASI